MKNSTCHITENGSGQLGIERERPLDLPGRLILFFFLSKIINFNQILLYQRTQLK